MRLLGVDRNVEFFYRGKLTKKHLALVERVLKRLGNSEKNDLEKASKELSTAKGSWDGKYKRRETSLSYHSPQFQELHDSSLNYLSHDYQELPVSPEPDEHQWARVYLEQKEGQPIFKIRIQTKAPGTIEGDWKTRVFVTLCDEIYYATKPLIGLGNVEEYTTAAEQAINRFQQSGKLSDLIITYRENDRYEIGQQSYRIKGQKEDDSRPVLAGYNPAYYSPTALKELQKTKLEINSNKLIKLSGGGLKDEFFEVPTPAKEAKILKTTKQPSYTTAQSLGAFGLVVGLLIGFIAGAVLRYLKNPSQEAIGLLVAVVGVGVVGAMLIGTTMAIAGFLAGLVVDHIKK